MRPKLITCPTCEGDGKNRYNTVCTNCGGTGTLTEVEARNRGLIENDLNPHT